MKLTYKDFNKMSLKELISLDGIGKTTAKRIIAYRPFRKNDELFTVKGLGAKTLAKVGIVKATKKRQRQKIYKIDGDEVAERFLARCRMTSKIDYFWRIPKSNREYLCA